MKPLIFLSCWMTLGLALAQPAPTQPSSILLWPDGAPGALGTADGDIPKLTPYFPEAGKATGAGVLICPGGGYGALASHEGVNYARWLNDQGIAGFVLQYRLATRGYHHPAMLDDAARAMRLIRSRAEQWRVNTNRIGIIGSSAGGHLAAMILTHFDAGNSNAPDPIDRVSDRPDLGILCYPVITMSADYVHKGSRDNLLGTNQPAALLEELSPERHVTSNTPPCFIFVTGQDTTVPVQNSLEFAAALGRAKVSYELHVYEKGRHGMGLGSRAYNPALWHPWTFECRRWLTEQGFEKPPALPAGSKKEQ